MELPEGWITYEQLRERNRRYRIPFTYAAVQMGAMANWPSPDALAKHRELVLKQYIPEDWIERDRPKRRSHIMKEILMLQPKGPRVLVKRIDAPKPASSTIIIPETVESEKSCYALVLAVGKAVTEDIKVADTVLLAAYSGGNSVTVELDGETLEAQIVMQDDILAVVIE